MSLRIVLTILVSSALLLSAAESNWPQWRGPLFNGSSPDASGLAVEWSTDRNVAWRAELPSWSAATPAVWGDTVFVTSAEEGFDSADASSHDDLLLLALNRTDGSVRWQRTVGDGNRIYRKQNLASPSPITDGRHVWVLTGGGQLSCYDMAGRKIWTRNIQQDYGAFGLNHGYASTPRLHRGRLFLQVLHGMTTDDPSYVFAVDPGTGETVWKVDRPTDATHESPDDYSTPLIVTADGTEQLVVSGGDYVTGHDLDSGKELWRMGGLNPGHERFYRTIASSINIGGTVFTPSTRGRPFIAFKAGGEGWITDTAKIWENERGADVPTPTTDGKRIFVVRDRGTLRVLDAKSGDLLAEELRLAPGTYSSSPLLADGRIYATNEEGATTVVDVENGYKVLATNILDDHTLASPIAVDGQIFLRTANFLYCIAPN